MRAIIFLFLVLAACSSRSSTMMTPEAFYTISLGTPVSQVVAENGKPYAIHPRGGGIEEYEYIEKVQADEELVRENHYFLKVSHGIVVSKRMTSEKSPAYDLIYQEDPNYPQYQTYPQYP